MKNWKTSVCGILGLTCASLSLIPELGPAAVKVLVVLAGAFPSLGSIFARDYDVTSEQSGLKSDGK